MQAPNLLICEPVNMGHALAIVCTVNTDAEVTALMALHPGRAMLVYQLVGSAPAAGLVSAPHAETENLPVAAKKKPRK